MLNYSWKASQNRWGCQEFNTSFSIGFGNGGLSDVARRVTLTAAAGPGTVTTFQVCHDSERDRRRDAALSVCLSSQVCNPARTSSESSSNLKVGGT